MQQSEAPCEESALYEKGGRARIDTRKTRDQRKMEEFVQVLEDSLPGPPANAQDRWEHFRDTVYNAVLFTFGKKTSKSADWFEAHSEEMTPVIEAKRQHTKPNPVSRTSRFSVLLAAKSSSVSDNAPETIGFSCAPRFRSQLTPATSLRCMMASSRHWAQRKRKLPL